jgi:hypothetical protein
MNSWGCSVMVFQRFGELLPSESGHLRTAAGLPRRLRTIARFSSVWLP